MKSHRILYNILLLGYTLGIFQGSLALWEEGNPQPVQIYPIRACMLPAADRELLAQGIRIGSDAELSSYLEDYLS